jgi:MFS family permease
VTATGSGDSALVALRSPALRRYLAGQLQSVTGSWIQVVALSWVLVQWHPASLGWVVALQFGPTVLFGPWFGPLIDRHDRRRILMAAEAGLGLVAAGYAVAAATDRLTLPLIFALATAWGILNALDTPARQALLPALVRGDQAARAAAVSGLVMLVSMTAGSALGAIVVGVAGPAVAFLTNAVSFGLDVVILSTIAVVAPARVGRAPRQLRDGLRYVWRTGRLRRPLLALAVVGALAFTVPVSVPLLLRQEFAGGASLLGLGFTAVTAGGIVGALVAAVRRAPTPHSLSRGCALMAASLATVALSPDVPVVLAALVGIGLAWSLLVATTIARLQSAEDVMMGRVMSWLAVVLVGGPAVGGPLASTLGTSAGPRAPFVLGAGAAVLAIVILRWRRKADPERPEPGEYASRPVVPDDETQAHAPHDAPRPV